MPTLSQEFGFPTNLPLVITPGVPITLERIEKTLRDTHEANLRRPKPLEAPIAQFEALTRVQWWYIRKNGTFRGGGKGIIFTVPFIESLPAGELGLQRVPGTYRFRLDQDWTPASPSGPGVGVPGPVGDPGPIPTAPAPAPAGPIEAVQQAIAATDPTLLMVGVAAAAVGVVGLSVWLLGEAKKARGAV